MLLIARNRIFVYLYGFDFSVGKSEIFVKTHTCNCSDFEIMTLHNGANSIHS